jgi:hypothetical protein
VKQKGLLSKLPSRIVYASLACIYSNNNFISASYMTKLNILLWASLFLLVSCAHTKEDTLLELKLSKGSCYESDTVSMQVLINNIPYEGTVRWNQNDIIPLKNSYLFIPSPIHQDSLTINITATVNGQNSTRELIIYNAEGKFPSVSYASIIQPLLTGNCNFSGCHGNGSRGGKVELSIYDSVMQSVTPFNASSSLLYVALVKTDPLRVMPPAGMLHDYKIEDVRVWIEQGARNN